VAQMIACTTRTGQHWQQGLRSFGTMIQMTVEPNLVAYNVTVWEDSFGFFVVGFLVCWFFWKWRWENAQIWRSRGM